MRKIVAFMFVFIISLLHVYADNLPDDFKIVCDKEGMKCLGVGSEPFGCFNCSTPVAYKSTDGKKTWKKIVTMKLGYVYAVYINTMACRSDLKHCLVLGDYNTGHENSDTTGALFVTTHDYGQHWFAQNFQCAEISWSWTKVNSYTCDHSWTHCVAVGGCNDGIDVENVRAVGFYLESPNKLIWAKGLDYLRAPYSRLNKVTCSDEPANLTCRADGEASDDAINWRRIMAISTDSGKSWVYQNNIGH